MADALIRKANISDVKAIKGLIDYYAGQNKVLPRSMNELYENMRDFWVCEDKGALCGCLALHIAWEDLAEIKSLVIEDSKRGQGIGKKLFLEALKEAKELKVKRVFVLTYLPDFFKKFGFREISNSKLPHKVWTECIHCVKFPDCDEKALIKDLDK